MVPQLCTIQYSTVSDSSSTRALGDTAVALSFGLASIAIHTTLLTAVYLQACLASPFHVYYSLSVDNEQADTEWNVRTCLAWPISRRGREQGKMHFSPCLADHDEQDCQPYPADPYSPINDDHAIHRLDRHRPYLRLCWQLKDTTAHSRRSYCRTPPQDVIYCHVPAGPSIVSLVAIDKILTVLCIL